MMDFTEVDRKMRDAGIPVPVGEPIGETIMKKSGTFKQYKKEVAKMGEPKVTGVGYKTCPECGAVNGRTLAKCKGCGYEFKKGKKKRRTTLEKSIDDAAKTHPLNPSKLDERSKRARAALDAVVQKHMTEGGALKYIPPEEMYQDPRPDPSDNWKHRSSGMTCGKCMWYCNGRCRKHAPTLDGWPAMYSTDWCGDHKLPKEAMS